MNSYDMPKIFFFTREKGMDLVREREGACLLNMRTGKGEKEEDGAEE